MNKLRVSPEEIAKRRFLRHSLRGAVAGGGALLLGGCDRLGNTEWFPKVLASGESLSQGAHRALGGRRSMAQEFSAADVSPSFRGNGNTDPEGDDYKAHAAQQFANWKLKVDGLVEQPRAWSLAELRALPSRTQITRHDCVEGWSAIGKWTGVPLARLLEAVRPKPDARFAVFHCADTFEDGGQNVPYYESVDMDDAYHPQTILAWALNDATLPVTNGAPLRLRVERQLGYKQAKYVMRIELVESFAHMGGGKGGYWEDQGYQWYAGI
jgi:DMSO/TMAO reductase YedYZ molybdopterin-dependent catalytic subunit